MARRPSYQTTAATSPASEGVIGNGAAYPQVLDPEHGPQSIHRSDLFFINSTPQMNTRQNAEFSQRSPNAASPSISNQLYPYHQQAFHHFTPPAPAARPPQSFYAQPLPSYTQRPLTDLSPPPVPPKPKFKPIVYPPIKTTTNYDQYAAAPPPPLPPLAPAPPVQSGEITASPTDDSNELAMALALSQSESIERQKLQEELRNQEEEDLARALAESMLSTGSNINPSVDPFFTSPPERVISSSGTTVDDPGTATSPARAPVDLPSQSSQNATSTAHPTPSSNPTFPEFGRHDKWRLPGLSDRPQEEDSAPEVQSEPMGRKSPTTPSFPSSFNDATPVTARPRPSSISSVSSLPYTLPDPEPQTPERREIKSQDRKDSLPSYAQTDGTEFSPRSITPPASSAAYANVDLIIPSDSEETNVLVFDDEAYARQLAAEEEAMARQEQQYPNEKARPMVAYGGDSGQPLPLYTADNQQYGTMDGPMSGDPLYPGPSSNTTNSNETSQPIPMHHPIPQVPQDPPPPIPEHTRPPFGRTQQARPPEFDFRPISSLTTGPSPSIPFSPVVYPSLGKHRESESDTLSEVSHHSSNHSSASAPPGTHSERVSQMPPSIRDERRPSFSGPSSLPRVDDRPSGSALPISAAGVLNANHFLDRELLLGVSIGFKPPAISTALAPMQDPMPNIISLPYARCPPLHLQAPDWRHLLRLMARLSGTRIEPTIEAMAITKTDLKLRTVVQFIKPHPNSNEWRTILWFTIDHPIPPSAPGASRYLSGNPNLLPWSYTLSPVPMLLRDATDTQISKTYTIPATGAVPLPTLPITFPNLALYLQAALDASRRHSGDSSSGLGKLGKVVQMCYPSEQTFSEFDIPERSSVSHLFKRVIGRSNKDKKKGKTTNNEETYQLVTPFVPDEWG